MSWKVLKTTISIIDISYLCYVLIHVVDFRHYFKNLQSFQHIDRPGTYALTKIQFSTIIDLRMHFFAFVTWGNRSNVLHWYKNYLKSSIGKSHILSCLFRNTSKWVKIVFSQYFVTKIIYKIITFLVTGRILYY